MTASTVTVRVRVGTEEGLRDTEAHRVGVEDREGERVWDGDLVRLGWWLKDLEVMGEGLLVCAPLPLLDTLELPLAVLMARMVRVGEPAKLGVSWEDWVVVTQGERLCVAGKDWVVVIRGERVTEGEDVVVAKPFTPLRVNVVDSSESIRG